MATAILRLWIQRWRQMTEGRVEYIPSQDPRVPERFPQIPREEFDRSVQLVETDGRVFSGAEAVFRSLAQNPQHDRGLGGTKLPAIRPGDGGAYRVVGTESYFVLMADADRMG